MTGGVQALIRTATSPCERRAIWAVAPVGAVRFHIAETLRQIAAVRFEAAVADLNHLSATARPMAAILYLDGSYDQTETVRWVAQVRQLRASWHALPLIGYAPMTPQAFQQGVHATKAGVDDVALHGCDGLCEIVGRHIAATARRGMTDEILQQVVALGIPVDAETVRIVRYCIEHARESLTVGQMARGLYSARRTIANRLRAAHLPPPESLIMWTRLLVAAWLLQDPVCTINEAARRLGWRDLSTLRSLSMSYLGHQPRLLREPGAIARVVTNMIAAGGKVRHDR
jgi:AraC-like DNA-binding protein